jgi:hypothetical protein
LGPHCEIWLKNKKGDPGGPPLFLPIFLLWHFQRGICAMFRKFIFGAESGD